MGGAVPLHGGACHVATGEEWPEFFAQGVFDVYAWNASVFHAYFFAVVEKWGAFEGEQEHGFDFGFFYLVATKPEAVDASKEVVVGEH